MKCRLIEMMWGDEPLAPPWCECGWPHGYCRKLAEQTDDDATLDVSHFNKERTDDAT